MTARSRPPPFSQISHPVHILLEPNLCTPATWSISRVETSTWSGRAPGNRSPLQQRFPLRGLPVAPIEIKAFCPRVTTGARLPRNRVASRGDISALRAAFSAHHPKLDVAQHDSPEDVEMGLYSECYAGCCMHARCAARLGPEACESSIAEKLDARPMEHGSPEANGWK